MSVFKKLFTRIKGKVNSTKIICWILMLCYCILAIVNEQTIKYIQLPGFEISFYDKTEESIETTTQNPDCQVEFITASLSVDTPERLCISRSFACHSGYCRQNARSSLQRCWLTPYRSKFNRRLFDIISPHFLTLKSDTAKSLSSFKKSIVPSLFKRISILYFF